MYAFRSTQKEIERERDVSTPLRKTYAGEGGGRVRGVTTEVLFLRAKQTRIPFLMRTGAEVFYNADEKR